MAELIPTINWTDFLKVAKRGKLKELKSSEVNFDGEYLFTFVRPNSDFIRIQTENMSQLSNAVSGKSLAEILKQEVKV